MIDFNLLDNSIDRINALKTSDLSNFNETNKNNIKEITNIRNIKEEKDSFPVLNNFDIYDKEKFYIKIFSENDSDEDYRVIDRDSNQYQNRLSEDCQIKKIFKTDQNKLSDAEEKRKYEYLSIKKQANFNLEGSNCNDYMKIPAFINKFENNKDLNNEKSNINSISKIKLNNENIENNPISKQNYSNIYHNSNVLLNLINSNTSYYNYFAQNLLVFNQIENIIMDIIRKLNLIKTTNDDYIKKLN